MNVATNKDDAIYIDHGDRILVLQVWDSGKLTLRLFGQFGWIEFEMQEEDEVMAVGDITNRAMARATAKRLGDKKDDDNA